MEYRIREWNGYRNNSTSNSCTHLKNFYFKPSVSRNSFDYYVEIYGDIFLRFKSQYLRQLNVFACNFLPFKIKFCRQVFRVGSIVLMTHNNHLNPKLVSLPIIRSLISTIPTQLHWTIHTVRTTHIKRFNVLGLPMLQ